MTPSLGVNADGMDYYTGVVMYVDALYGSSGLLDAILDTRSASGLKFPRAADFLTGLRTSLHAENEITLNLPSLGEADKEQTIVVYLPPGGWDVSMQGSTFSWRVPTDSKTGIACTTKTVSTRTGGWYPLTYLRTRDASAARLVLRKRR